MVESRENAIKLISSVACANICSSLCSTYFVFHTPVDAYPWNTQHTTHRVHWTCSRKDVHALNRRYIMCQPNKKPTKYILPSSSLRCLAVILYTFKISFLFCLSSHSSHRIVWMCFCVSCNSSLVRHCRAGRVLYNAYNMYISDMKKP